MAQRATSGTALSSVLERLARLENERSETSFERLRDDVLGGSSDGWTRFVEKYSRFVYAVALRLSRGSPEPGDAAAAIYAETFDRIRANGFALLRNFRGRCRFTTYLYRVVLSQRKEQFRAARRDRAEPIDRVDEPRATEKPEFVLQPERLRDEMVGALDRLDGGERLLIACRFRDGLRLRELAPLFGFEDTNGVARALYKALDRLRNVGFVRRAREIGGPERAFLAEELRTLLEELGKREEKKR